MPGHTPHRTPLKRVSQGSLFAFSRSGNHPDAPHGLGFIEPVMAELVDEVEALQANVDGLRKLSNSLKTFNESFASWLYVMDMNALTVDWPQAPTDASFQLAKRRAEENARLAEQAALKAASAVPPDLEADKTTFSENPEFETTYTTNATTRNASTNIAKTTSTGIPKKKAKIKLTPKEKKERSLSLEKIVMSLPLEFRGSDPGLRRNMESVIEFMMDSDGRGVKLIELIKPPDLNQARVNKCLIALVNRKIVQKESSTGTVLYHWTGLS
ncbi:DASH complex subunit Dam1-domain-containing protein [Suillus clintonianus]|uniref:DASH complex subunit Dam1-domain-containing protein n=1 Tax=Suillus clintonianus TaxID=1904413 RepID=UPI001B88011D|nr:DASH complex subunit Dam1-domain-containing protein [Suillus clintonianus]KAG2119209.1 DASH complex subunit Dam1-domain-containing protein [Suillus clintonianus]